MNKIFFPIFLLLIAFSLFYYQINIGLNNEEKEFICVGLFAIINGFNDLLLLIGHSISILVAFFNKYILGVFGLAIVIYAIYALCHDHEIEWKYKREKNGNDEKYIALRCTNDSCDAGENSKDKKISGWDHIYLVEKEDFNKDGKKKFHRIVNRHTLNRLGYPRPIREDCDVDRSRFYKKNDYILGEEIEIVDLFSIVSNFKEAIK